jgi:hypothetical protein
MRLYEDMSLLLWDVIVNLFAQSASIRDAIGKGAVTGCSARCQVAREDF